MPTDTSDIEEEIQTKGFDAALEIIWNENFGLNEDNDEDITLKRMSCLGGVAMKCLGIISEYDPEMWLWVQDQILENNNISKIKRTEEGVQATIDTPDSVN